MMKLEARKRSAGEILDRRKEIPAVVYGKGVEENLNIAIGQNDFVKVFSETGYSTIIDLSIDGEDHDVLIKEVQIDPREDIYNHVDFYAVTKGQEVEVSVELNFSGESGAVKTGGILSTSLTEVDVKAMPRNLPSELPVDLSKLEKIGDSIRLSDIDLPEGVTFSEENHEVVIVSVTEAKTAEQEEEAQSEGPEFKTEESDSSEEKTE